MKLSKKTCFLLIALLNSALFASCASEGSKPDATNEANAKPMAQTEIKELRIALVPSDDADKMMSQFEKLRSYLENKLGIPVSVSKVTSYAACIEAMKKKRIEVAWYGPTSYVLAEQEANAEAFLVAQDTKKNTSYRSMFLVPAASPIKTLADLKGKNIGLVEASSTSGGLIPSYIVLTKQGVSIEKFGNVVYLGSHDAVVNAIKSGGVDAGATNNLTIDRLIEQGTIKSNELRVIEQSDALPGSPLAWRKDLPEDFKKKLVSGIMESSAELGTYKVAGFGEIAGFQPVGAKDYKLIRDIAGKLGLTREQLLK